MGDLHIDAPVVRLGPLSEDSVAASIYVLVHHGAQRRPALAHAMRGRIRMRFLDGYAPVRVDFRGEEIEVSDDLPGEDRAHDLEVVGRLGDVSALIVAPLAGGLPKPTTRRGRAALARLADGRVDFDGPLSLGRSLLKLLALDAPGVPKPARVRRAGTEAP